MMERLFVRVDLEGDFASWVVTDGSGHVQSDSMRGSLEMAVKEAAGRQVIAIAPAGDVLLTRVFVPTQNRQRLIKAVPFVLEDQLADDIESLHFALGRRRANGELPVAVVARKNMEAWLGGLRGAGLDPEILIPEQLLVPLRDDEWGVLIRDEMALVRTQQHFGFVADRSNLAFLLQTAILEDEENKPACIRLYKTGEDAVPLPNLAELDTDITEETGQEDVIAFLARGFNANEAINLLQGPYGRGTELERSWRRWRPAAALAGLWLLLQGGMGIVEYQRLAKETQRLNQEIEQLYRGLFPEARKMVNARAQMESRLKALRSKPGKAGSGFLSLLTQSGHVLRSTPGVELKGMSYRDGRLDLDIAIGNLQELDGLKKRILEQPGLDVEIQSAVARDGKVGSRLRIRSGRS